MAQEEPEPFTKTPADKEEELDNPFSHSSMPMQQCAAQACKRCNSLNTLDSEKRESAMDTINSLLIQRRPGDAHFEDIRPESAFYFVDLGSEG
jgi:hypothetical protein